MLASEQKLVFKNYVVANWYRFVYAKLWITVLLSFLIPYGISFLFTGDEASWILSIAWILPLVELLFIFLLVPIFKRSAARDYKLTRDEMRIDLGKFQSTKKEAFIYLIVKGWADTCLRKTWMSSNSSFSRKEQAATCRRLKTTGLV